MLILEQFLRVHSSYWMCNQFTLHHKFRIDTGRTKLKQGKTDSILYGCESHGQGTQRSVQAWLDQTTSCTVQAEEVEKNTRTRCIGSIHSLLNVKDWSSIKQDVMQSIILYDTLSACCISKVVVMEYGQIIYEKVYASPRPPPTISFTDNWMKELDSEVAGSSKDTQRIQPKPKTQQSRTVRPVGGQQFTQKADKFVIDDDDMDSDTVTDSNFSLKSLSFLHRVNDRLRKMLDHSKDAMQDIDRRSLIWGMFMSSTLEASVFMGKDYSENLHSIKNTGNNLTLKQMVDISERLVVGQSDEIFGVSPINWEDSSWKKLSLVNNEGSHQSIARKGFCIFGFRVMSWKGESEPNIK